MINNLLPDVETDRLILRSWTDADRAPLAQLCSDPLVMEHIPPPDRLDVARITNPLEEHFARSDGLGWWAIAERSAPTLIGFIGLSEVHSRLPFAPAIEIGWCLGYNFWGKGYGLEAARRACDYAFSALGLNEIVAFTTPANRRARAMMERLGMTHDPAQDFDYPRLEEGSPFKHQVLYRLAKPNDLSSV